MPHKDPKKNKAYRSTAKYRRKAAARTKAWLLSAVDYLKRLS